MKHIVILGAGISGLSAAWFQQKKAKITILEKSSRIGGWIRSIHKDGFLFEEGPRGFLSKGNGKTTLQLCEALNLKSQLILANNSAKKRYLYHKGKLQHLNFFFLLRMNMLKHCLKEWRLTSLAKNDESIGDFFERRFHPIVVATLIDPMVKGIYGGDPYKLSLRACFPLFHKWEQDYGSLTKALFYSRKETYDLYSFKDGMETLPKTLAEKLEAEIYLKTKPEKICLEKDKILIHTDTKTYEADHVIAAIPSKSLFHLFSDLPQIPSLTLTTVSMGFSKPLNLPKGFGYLIPSQERESILGMTWDSQVFSRPSTTLCVMISGQNQNALSIAQEALSRHLQIKDKPTALHIHIAQNAIPQYPVGYVNQLAKFSYPRLSLIGNSYFGPGINDCIAKAESLRLT